MLNTIDERDPHRAEAEGKHLGDAPMVEEHDAAEKLKHVVVATENPVDLLGAADYREVDHPSYRHRTPLSAGVQRSLAGDLAEEA